MYLLSQLKDKIHSITLERMVCYGSCPVYRVTFNKNGKAVYEGKDHVERIGRYVGEIEQSDFDKIAELLDRLGFGNLSSSYSSNDPEKQSVVTSVSYNDGEKKVENKGDAGPMELWTVEKVIDGVVQDIYWEEEE